MTRVVGFVTPCCAFCRRCNLCAPHDISDRLYLTRRSRLRCFVEWQPQCAIKSYPHTPPVAVIRPSGNPAAAAGSKDQQWHGVARFLKEARDLLCSAVGRGASAMSDISRHTACLELLESRVLFSTYYVSPSGNDAALGTSDAAAWKTLQKAGNTAAAGDTVLVRAGTYTVGMNLFGKT